MNSCSRAVFRCFKALERVGDRITGAAGPVFVGLAIILMSAGVVSFFDVIVPSLPFKIISLPICMLITLNLFAHYFYACTITPGFVDDPPQVAGTGWLWAKKRSLYRNGRPLTRGVRWSAMPTVTAAEETKCLKCGKMRPERAHHCRICMRCVLKYDHHCPIATQWVNQCVGVYNERHFVLFLLYLVLSTLCFSVLGYRQFFDSLGLSYFAPWPYHVPEVIYLMIYLLSVVLCLAVGIMASFHIWGILFAETTVEAQDHRIYRKRARSRGEVFVNCYDVGPWKNLLLFFNVGDGGYPYYTLLFPLRIPSFTDGRSWARKDGYTRHHGVRLGEELTDDEGDEDDEN